MHFRPFLKVLAEKLMPHSLKSCTYYVDLNLNNFLLRSMQMWFERRKIVFWLLELLQDLKLIFIVRRKVYFRPFLNVPEKSNATFSIQFLKVSLLMWAQKYVYLFFWIKYHGNLKKIFFFRKLTTCKTSHF